MGWLRRNIWGLVLLLPALVGLGAVSWQELYYNYWMEEPRVSATAGSDGWYTLESNRIRLVSFAQAELETYSGRPFEPEGPVVIWRATIEFDAPKDSMIGGCQMDLEDDQGRHYAQGPTADVSGAADAVSAGCLSDVDLDDEAARFVNDSFFALPEGARPVAIRIWLATSLPGYVRLTT